MLRESSVLESSLRDAPHWYLKANEAAFSLGAAAFTCIGVREVLAEHPIGGFAFGGVAIVLAVAGAVANKLDGLKTRIDSTGKLQQQS